ncbi:MAG: tetratricopeptide repeat protein [Thiohalospira sp.]
MPGGIRDRTGLVTGLLTAVVLLVSPPVAAEEAAEGERAEESEAEGVVATLRKLVEAGDHDAALRVAREHRSEHMGEPEFDFWYALAAMEAGDPNQGVFALERVLTVHPESRRARLELARAHFRLGDFGRARSEFRRVLESEPPPLVAQRIRAHLDAMDRREAQGQPSWSGWVEAGLGHDTNVKSGPDEFLLGPFRLADAEADGDHYANLGAGARGRVPTGEGQALYGRAEVGAVRHPDLSDFDNTVLDAAGGYQWTEERYRIRTGLEAGSYRLGGDRYQDRFGLAASGRYRAAEGWGAGGFLRLRRLDYTDSDSRDSRFGLMGVTGEQSLPVAWSPRFATSLLFGAERPIEDSEGARARAHRDLHGLNLALTLRPRGDLVARLGLRALMSEYDEGETLLVQLPARDETLNSADLRLHWEPSPRWRVTPSIRYSANDSNVDIYEYRRTRYEVAVRYTFR